MPLIVHHLQNSQSERIPWLCEELGISYELKLYQRDPLLCPPDLAALHPMKAAPVITDTNFEPPVVLAESPAIIDYIIHKYGNGRLALPPAHSNYADYLYWFNFTNGTLQPALGRLMTLQPFTKDLPPTDPRISTAHNKFRNTLAYLNSRLAANTWLSGNEFTAADIMLVFSLTTMRTFFPYELSEYTGILGVSGQGQSEGGICEGDGEGRSAARLEGMYEGCSASDVSCDGEDHGHGCGKGEQGVNVTE